MQRILVVTTLEADMRSKIDVIDCECGYTAFVSLYQQFQEYDGVFNNIPVDHAESPDVRNYATPIHVLADDWNLMAPPKQVKDGEVVDGYEWWFCKSVSR